MRTEYYNEASSLNPHLRSSDYLPKNTDFMDVFSVDQTCIAMNKDIHIVRSSENVSMSSNVCVVVTDEVPYQFTYGCNVRFMVHHGSEYCSCRATHWLP